MIEGCLDLQQQLPAACNGTVTYPVAFENGVNVSTVLQEVLQASSSRCAERAPTTNTTQATLNLARIQIVPDKNCTSSAIPFMYASPVCALHSLLSDCRQLWRILPSVRGDGRWCERERTEASVSQRVRGLRSAMRKLDSSRRCGSAQLHRGVSSFLPQDVLSACAALALRTGVRECRADEVCVQFPEDGTSSPVWVQELGIFVNLECFVPSGEVGPVQCFYPMRLNGEGECEPACPLPLYTEEEWRITYGVLYSIWVSTAVCAVVFFLVVLNEEKRRFPGIGLTLVLAGLREFRKMMSPSTVDPLSNPQSCSTSAWSLPTSSDTSTRTCGAMSTA